LGNNRRVVLSGKCENVLNKLIEKSRDILPLLLRHVVLYYALPMRNILVPHFIQIPWVPGLPFFILTALIFFISRLDLHFMQ